MTQYEQEIVSLNPYFWFRLDELSGTTIADSSINNSDGTVVGSPDLGVPPILPYSNGAAISFTDDAQSITVTNPLPVSTSFSIGVWVSGITNYNNTQAALFADNNGTGYKWIIGYQIGAYGTDTFKIYHSGGSSLFTVPGIGDGNSHHIVFSFDHENDMIRVYCDGQLADYVNVVLSFGQNATIYIGRWTSTQKCAMDDVFFAPGALTDQQVAAIYGAALIVPGYTISGIVELDGSPYPGIVRVYAADTGELLNKTTADPGDGSYSLSSNTTGDVYVMAIDGAGVRPLVHGPISGS